MLLLDGDVQSTRIGEGDSSTLPLLADGGHHILLLHAHDETEALAPGYWRGFIDRLLEAGVTFDEPAFCR